MKDTKLKLKTKKKAKIFRKPKLLDKIKQLPSNLKKSLKTVFSEYRQVKWPTLKTTLNLAFFVLIISAIITLMLIGLDAFFYYIRSIFIIK